MEYFGVFLLCLFFCFQKKLCWKQYIPSEYSKSPLFTSPLFANLLNLRLLSQRRSSPAHRGTLGASHRPPPALLARVSGSGAETAAKAVGQEGWVGLVSLGCAVARQTAPRQPRQELCRRQIALQATCCPEAINGIGLHPFRGSLQ